MRLTVIYFLLFLLVVGCSSQEKAVRDTEPLKAQTVELSSKEKEQKAQEYFVEGALLEMKGNIAAAILEYQEALAIDPQPGIHYAMSKGYLKLNKLPQAIKHAQQAVEMDKDDVDFNYLLAQTYVIAGVPDSAAVVFEKIIDLDSTNYQAYYSLGNIYEAEKPLKALSVYNKMIEKTGPQWDVLLKIAELNERMGNVDETVATLEKLVGLNPSDLKLQKLLIESYIKTDKFDKALSKIDETLQLYPNDPNLIEYRANTYIQTGKWEKGADDYRQLIDDENVPYESKLGIGRAFLGEAYEDSTLFPVAKEIFEAIDADTSDWQVDVILAEIHSGEGDDSTAVKYLKDAAENASWNVEIWMRLGGLLFDTGRYVDAAAEMEEAVELFPNEFVLNLIGGLAYSQLNMNEPALPYLEKSVELNPRDITSLSALGFTLNQLGREDEALKYLERGQNLDPDNMQILSLLGLIYDHKEMYDKVNDVYEKALILEPENAMVLNNYAYSLSEQGVELERALEMVETALEQEPENSSYLDTMGWIHYKLGNYEEARGYIYKALEQDENNAEVLDHLADVYFKMGNKERARELWTQAYENDPDNDKIKQKIEEGIL